MLALWDTVGADVVRKLAAERRSGSAGGLALTLIAITDDASVRPVEDAAAVAAAMHPCRLLVVVRDSVGGRPDVQSRLDAEIVVGGRLGPCEAVVLRMRGRLALHAESVVMPLLAPDVPVVTWWHGTAPERIAYDPLGVIADRRITDVAQCPDPIAALRQRAEDYTPGDTDLAWTRLTPWRTLLAGALDTVVAGGGSPGQAPPPTDPAVAAAEVTAADDDPRAALLGGWLRARLGLAPTVTGGAGLDAVVLRLADGGELSLTRQDGTVVLHRSGQAERVLPLVHRRLGDELAEELRRLDADQPYAAALAAATGQSGLDDRTSVRVHIWHDPAVAEHPDGLDDRPAQP